MSDRRHDERIEVHLSARLRPGICIALDMEGAKGDIIQHVTVTDLSGGGFSMLGNTTLFLGSPVMVEVPLVGWREAHVMWMAEGRIGCQFAEPLSAQELEDAVASDGDFNELFPGLVAQMTTRFDTTLTSMPLAGGAVIELELAVRLSERGVEVLSVDQI
ncbi:PilZ domain-containing protein [Sphingomonas crocodyli]|uniref:PilZ domain-containing protein n=1 Tax=Sphingomonas crocodyli TaxID=1979270 RepID=A0A437M8M7_9SPHN|nr:PilZ domain-containing protein [Sphingomonas crocodyli]RVT94078.1 PilZ domain-containing protein [Sphingomonas crocodyli]